MYTHTCLYHKNILILYRDCKKHYNYILQWMEENSHKKNSHNKQDIGLNEKQ